MTRPNRRATDAGHTLQHVIARQVADALDHLRRELSLLDGYGTGSPEVAVQATAELTPVEAVADARLTITRTETQIRSDLNEIIEGIHDLHRLCNQALAMRQPRNVRKPDEAELCAHGQRGKEGALEWGDPLCPLPGVKGGMCQAHYYRWYRHRVDHGVDTSRDFEPAR